MNRGLAHPDPTPGTSPSVIPVTGHLVLGPAQHGVVIFAQRLAAQLGGPVLTAGTADEVTEALLALAFYDADLVLTHYTDALFGGDTASAAAAFCGIRRRTGLPVAVTLHDVPDADDEPGRYARRSASYRHVALAADAVVVASEHERSRLLALLGRDHRRHHPHAVIGLPLDPVRPLEHLARPEPLPEVGVLGFLYPGKGHHEALQAMAELAAGMAFTAIGRPADGHEQIVHELRGMASAHRRPFQVTGFVPERDLAARLQRVAVPVAPSVQVSASGSINTWIEAGRRPLVAEGRYSREFHTRHPGAIRLYTSALLPGLIRESLARPELTWLSTSEPIGPSPMQAARSYQTFLATISTLSTIRTASRQHDHAVAS